MSKYKSELMLKRVIFTVIGFAFFYFLSLSLVLPLIGKECKTVKVTTSRIDNSASKTNTNWKYQWSFKVRGDKFEGETITNKEFDKDDIGPVYYFDALPSVNTLKLGSPFTFKAILGLILGSLCIWFANSKISIFPAKSASAKKEQKINSAIDKAEREYREAEEERIREKKARAKRKELEK